MLAKTILVPVDFSAFSRAAIERALGLAAALNAGIRLLHVLHLPPIAIAYDASLPIWKDLRVSERKKLDSLLSEFGDRGIPISIVFEEGDPVPLIHRAARAADVELIVMGSHGLRGLDRLMLGSIAERTLHSAPVPVMIVREPAQEAAKKIERILFATDYSETARQAESILSRLSTALGARVEALHVVFETTVLFAPYALADSRRFDEELRTSAEQRMRSLVARLRDAGVDAMSQIVCGFASEEILRRADSTSAQLIVLGTRGHSGLRRFKLGSVVQRVLRHAACSVLVAGEEDDDAEKH